MRQRRNIRSPRHSTQGRPPALLGRLLRSNDAVRRPLLIASTLGALSTVALILQAVALARYIATWQPGYLAWLALGVSLRALLSFISEPLTFHSSAPLRRDLRSRALRALQSDAHAGPVESSLRLVTVGASSVGDFLATYVPALVVSLLAPLFAIAWIGLTDPLSGIIVASTVIVLPLYMVLLGLEAKAKMDERFEEHQRAAAYFGDIIRGLASLRAHRREQVVLAQVDAIEKSLASSTMATLRVAFLSSFALELLASLATALVALTLGIRLISGHIHLPNALAILLVTPEVYLPLRRAAARFHDANDGISAATALLDLADVPFLSGELIARDCSIRLVNLSLAYEDRDHGPRRVTVDIAPGSFVDVTGASGSGKSTLLRIIAGFLEPLDGSIIRGGHSSSELDLDEWQARLGYLDQRDVLSGDSVGDAIRARRLEISNDDIDRLLAEVALPVSRETPLRDVAANLSAGQRRRLALARALAGNPQLLLLDEPYGHLDPESVATIDAVLDARAGQITIVCATHRPSPRATQRIELS